MFDGLAMMMIMMWPAIPMFLIELNFAISFWRRIGLWTYLVIVVEWLPIGLVLYALQNQLLHPQIALGTPFLVLGIALIVAALALHGWTAKLIGLKATIGYNELKLDEPQGTKVLVTSGPFSVVRHPSSIVLRDYSELFGLKEQLSKIQGIKKATMILFEPFDAWPPNMFASLLSNHGNEPIS